MNNLKNNEKVDLHIHTTSSDGTISPEGILQMADEFGYKTIAISDHDTLDGYLKAIQVKKDYNVELIPGVEVSSLYEGYDVHILGYFVNPENKQLLEALEFIKQARMNRAEKMIQKLSKIGIIIEMDRLKEISNNGDLIGRPHIAKALVDLHYAPSVQKAFDLYIGDHCPSFMPKKSLHPSEIIKIIKEAGGISILAHPYRLKHEYIMFDVINMGIDGIEVFSKNQPQQFRQFYWDIAEEHNLLKSGGSDFHGKQYEIEEFGSFSFSNIYFEQLKEFWEKKRKNYGE